MQMNHLISFCAVGFIVLSCFIGSFQNAIPAEPDSQGTANQSVATCMNFTFMWGPDAQSNVNGTFRMEISLRLSIGADVPYTARWLQVVVNVNDVDYDPWDYLGLVFDMNENGVIDSGEAAIALLPNNITLPAGLGKNGFLIFPQCEPRPAYKGWECTFTPEIGYTFRLTFSEEPYGAPYFPHGVLKTGTNSLHVCFGGTIYSRFTFQLKNQ